jgi:hypothetical protein
LVEVNGQPSLKIIDINHSHSYLEFSYTPKNNK